MNIKIITNNWGKLPLLLTVEQVAAILGVSYSTVKNLIYSGSLPSKKITDRKYRVLKSELMKYVGEEVTNDDQIIR